MGSILIVVDPVFLFFFCKAVASVLMGRVEDLVRAESNGVGAMAEL